MKGVRVSSHDGERRWRNRWKGLRLGFVVSDGIDGRGMMEEDKEIDMEEA
jgi:hypothetical protein